MFERYAPDNDGRIYCESCLVAKSFGPLDDTVVFIATWNQQKPTDLPPYGPASGDAYPDDDIPVF